MVEKREIKNRLDNGLQQIDIIIGQHQSHIGSDSYPHTGLDVYTRGKTDIGAVLRFLWYQGFTGLVYGQTY